ncbi:MAG: pirin family protein [Alphaproteobacteria bacterium]|nr:pirin family protein [Alphaproteobacteria bacterium]MCB9929401.1 pirin family protein [Alphaproteobacteria bacterium]
MAVRPVARIVTAHQQKEGAGFLVRRPVPTAGLDQVDPFLMLDEVGPVEYAPGQALGAPDHPHRGFETVSYILAGEKLHEDSTGKSQLIRAGDVQWMTAGAGIIHSELPGPDFKASGGLAHGFQIWVNLPAAAKFAEPGYQYLPAAEIPRAESPDGRIAVTVVAGEAFGVRAAIGTHTPIWLQDWRVSPGGAAEIEVNSSFNIAAYVFDGMVGFGPDGVMVGRGQMAVFGPGDRFAVQAGETAGRFLLLAGEPLNEPVARYGPFVMNTKDEVIAAMQDFQTGRMGVIRR